MPKKLVDKKSDSLFAKAENRQVDSALDKKYTAWLREAEENVRQAVKRELGEDYSSEEKGIAWVCFPETRASFVRWMEGTNRGMKKPPRNWAWILIVEEYQGSLRHRELHATLLSDMLEKEGVKAFPESKIKRV